VSEGRDCDGAPLTTPELRIGARLRECFASATISEQPVCVSPRSNFSGVGHPPGSDEARAAGWDVAGRGGDVPLNRLDLAAVTPDFVTKRSTRCWDLPTGCLLVRNTVLAATALVCRRL
jgi:hypothetical protein